MSRKFNDLYCVANTPIKKARQKEYNKQYARRNQKNWEVYLKEKYGTTPVCGLCLKTLSWPSEKEDVRNVVHFDHKSDRLPIKTSPSLWLKAKAATSKNIDIFDSCDFGVLCRKCNTLLPTKGRLEWSINTLRYVWGNNWLKNIKLYLLNDDCDLEKIDNSILLALK